MRSASYVQRRGNVPPGTTNGQLLFNRASTAIVAVDASSQGQRAPYAEDCYSTSQRLPSPIQQPLGPLNSHTAATTSSLHTTQFVPQNTTSHTPLYVPIVGGSLNSAYHDGAQPFHPPPPPPQTPQYNQASYAPGPYIGQYAGAAGPPVRRKQVRATQACNHCRTRKQKCDEARPCQFCRENNFDCQYKDVPPPKSVPKPKTNSSH